ncbi:hypothetical protein Tco_0498962 [Tanacetum coccineum]
MDTKSEPFEETLLLSPKAAPLSPDYTLASPDYTPDTPYTDKESEPMEAFETRTALPSDSTLPLSPNHPLLTKISPTPTLSRPCYYHSTTRMAMRTQPTLSPGISARVTKAMALSPLSFHKRYKPSCETPTPSLSPPVVSPNLPFRKRYRGTSELIADSDTESEESEDESTNSESEEVSFKDWQQSVPVEDTTADGPLGLGYGAARRRDLELAEGPVPSAFEVG